MSSFRIAERSGVGLLIGIAGASGSGKTFSALRLARGLAGGDDRAIAFIDTEAGRAKHYAAAKGEQPTDSTFAFQHADLTPPFTPERYKALIEEADTKFKVIVIDSFSHEWDGEGGLMELHDEIHERMGGQDKQSIAAWKEPKLRHKRLVSRLLQCRAHLVICMRAEDKLRMETVKEQGNNGREYTKTKITAAKDLPPAERWQPICEKRFPYELITSLVLSPDAPGVAIPLKLQEQHRDAVLNRGRPIDEDVGRALAAWARGDTQTSAAPLSQPSDGAGRPPPAKPAPSPSSTFPGDFVSFGPRKYDPAQPEALPHFDDFNNDEWKALGAALRRLIERAPDDDTKREWERTNQPGLLLMANASPALRSWTLEPLPGVAAPAGEGASDFAGEASGASSTQSHQGRTA